MESEGVLDLPVHETSLAILDFETTGLAPGWDRVLEVSVFRIDPGQAPKLVFDSLVNPERPVAATEIHGITDGDVAEAPTFREIAGDLVRAIAGCVVGSYNVYFDIRFLAQELKDAGLPVVPPHMCVMYLRPMLGIGERCPLPVACALDGIVFSNHHAASSDARAAAELMHNYLATMKSHRITTFRELAQLRYYKFLESFTKLPLSEVTVEGWARCERLKPRRMSVSDRESDDGAKRGELIAQWEALKAEVTEKALGRRQKRRPDTEALESSGPMECGLALVGKTIVVTGTLEHYSRSQIEQTIKRLGGRATSSVSKNTDFVLVGSDPGSKADKARELGVKILDEAEFRRLVGETD